MLRVCTDKERDKSRAKNIYICHTPLFDNPFIHSTHNKRQPTNQPTNNATSSCIIENQSTYHNLLLLLLLLKHMPLHAILLDPITLLQRMSMRSANPIRPPITPIPVNPLNRIVPRPRSARVALRQRRAGR